MHSLYSRQRRASRRRALAYQLVPNLVNFTAVWFGSFYRVRHNFTGVGPTRLLQELGTGLHSLQQYCSDPKCDKTAVQFTKFSTRWYPTIAFLRIPLLLMQPSRIPPRIHACPMHECASASTSYAGCVFHVRAQGVQCEIARHHWCAHQQENPYPATLVAGFAFVPQLVR